MPNRRAFTFINFEKKIPLYGLILVCTFIDFEKKFPPARLFHPARLLVLVCSKFHSTHDPEQSIPKHCQSNPKAIPKYSKVFQSIPKYPKTSQSIPKFQWQEIASTAFLQRNAIATAILNTLVYRIDMHARFINFERKFPLHGLILVCTFIDFEKIFPPARLFFPAQQSYFGLHVY